MIYKRPEAKAGREGNIGKWNAHTKLLAAAAISAAFLMATLGVTFNNEEPKGQSHIWGTIAPSIHRAKTGAAFLVRAAQEEAQARHLADLEVERLAFVEFFADREAERIAAEQAEWEAVQAEATKEIAGAKEIAAAPKQSYSLPASEAKAFIYQHESGNDPTAWNSSGCFGLGQACPGQWLYDSCGYDYACQDAYFESYMAGRYGTWEAAYSFWLQNSWW